MKSLIWFFLFLSTTVLGQRTCGVIDLQSPLNQASPAQQNESLSVVSPLSAVTPINANDFILIPVVVHVVWRTAAQNITDAQICSQLAVLNEDYARRNTDATNTPSAFLGYASNPRIQFYLARLDPTGNLTTGITRTNTTVIEFDPLSNNQVKFTAQGGRDAWPANQYLNLWVANLAVVPGVGQLLGVTQMPESLASSPSTDGVVIHWQAFGDDFANNIDEFNSGRTATHETGHWLNLKHIWGSPNNTGSCSDTDNVSDTPNQFGPNLDVPTFPVLDNCTTSNPGVMFMDYMDFTDDAVMNMFTSGQATRMRANFNPGGFRQYAAYAANGVSIAGNEPVCTSSNFTITNPGLPAFLTIGSWTSSNTAALTMSSAGKGTRKNNYSGQVTITANINSGGCNSMQISRTIQVGPFNASQVTVSGSPGVCPGQNTFTANVPGGHISSYTYQWTKPANWTLVSQVANTVTYSIPSNPDYGALSVRVANSCGYSPYSGITVYPGSCFSSFAFNVSPNPADNVVNVELAPSDEETKVQNTEEFSIELFSDQGASLMTSKSLKQAMSIDVSDLRKGYYILKIFYKKEVVAKRLSIE